MDKKITDGIKIATAAIVAFAAVGLAPLVSVIAVPVFAAKALLHWNEHRSLYNRTLTDFGRAKFGRIGGQNYMRWDGKNFQQSIPNASQIDKIHEVMGSYLHGSPDAKFRYDPSAETQDSPFKTPEDLAWLTREFQRKEKEDLLDNDLKMLRAFSKALIPIIGVIWVLYTEFSVGGASEMGCRGCLMGGPDAENAHWGWREAIRFHSKSLIRRLEISPSIQVLIHLYSK